MYGNNITAMCRTISLYYALTCALWIKALNNESQVVKVPVFIYQSWNPSLLSSVVERWSRRFMVATKGREFNPLRRHVSSKIYLRTLYYVNRDYIFVGEIDARFSLFHQVVTGMVILSYLRI